MEASVEAVDAVGGLVDAVEAAGSNHKDLRVLETAAQSLNKSLAL